MLTPKTAAERLGVSISLVYSLCSSGVLPHFRFGNKNRRGSVRIDEAELQAYVERCRREVSASAPLLSLRHINLG